ncbi:glutamate-tRNA ligase [Cyphellophora europaea CBS 101466]|uniref:Glutamate--tRNA ligase, mitochondrial n=1 Tax=Cyphellophora europaea (strain CBS 101466) TaxID=1220924 RepID=W2RVA6_CYPE1|nr:glutamate-tRNA ligase [Cyphellophora europaea CBS 101466]ETN40431.1 glutamate-tRNA ligase [Cyphellophora europaea CBS 101466]
MQPVTRIGARFTTWTCKSCRDALRGQHHAARPNVPSRFFASTRKLNRGNLPDSPARTRFAPSPTGNLHLGSIRTALFNYLLARKTKGQFLLRLEDTDQKRTIPGAEERLYRDLQWAGLEWDEGPVINGPYGPYRQSERLSSYHAHIQGLLQASKAYRCFCSAERLDDLNRRRHDKGLNLGYDRKCADMPVDEAEQRAHSGEAHVVRFRAPETWPRYRDLVYGHTGHGEKANKKLYVDAPVWEDAILIKSDGFPTYHWANVCDDHDMRITHVVRGSEWMASTPLHIAMYAAKEWTPPLYAHVPLLVDQNKQKLSKRNFDTDIASFRDKGIFPEALVNFAALLGWSHQQKSDIMSLRELEQSFDLKITKGNTVVSFEKLRFLQEQHGRRRISAGGDYLEQLIRDVAVSLLNKEGAAKIAALVGKRNLRDVVASMLHAESLAFSSPLDFAEKCSIFVTPPRRPKLDIEDSQLVKELHIAASTLLFVPESQWTQATHSENLKDMDFHGPDADPKSKKKWKGQLYHYLRWALLGGVPGPNIPQTMEILGRPICVDRIQRAISESSQESKQRENMSTRPQILKTATDASTWSAIKSEATAKS